jgi:eukaryotic-like serine/threonine-protein kinase
VVEKANTRARRIGRYLICGELAAGGMATVHIGRLLGPVGFARTVAIKRLHPQFAKDPEFVSMFLDEARLAARIRHPNVVPVLDVVASDGELFLVMDFVIGESVSRLCRLAGPAREGVPVRIAVAILCGALQGLHAAHETRGEKGDALGIVHRDISPQNILLGNDGAARLIDFGIAKAMGRVHSSQSGQLKGKLPYMAPEHVRGEATKQSDVFSAGVVLWELIAGRRLFAGETEIETFTNVLQAEIKAPSKLRRDTMRGAVEPTVARRLDDVILKSLERDVTKRFGTAREFAIALERVIPPASTLEVSEWMESAASEVLKLRFERVAEVEEMTTGSRGQSMAALTQEIKDARHSTSDATEILGPPSGDNMVPVHLDPNASPPPPGVPISNAELPSSRTAISHVTQQPVELPLKRRRTSLWIAGGSGVGLIGIFAVAAMFLSHKKPPETASGPPAPSLPTAEPTSPMVVPTSDPSTSPSVAAGGTEPSATAKKPPKRVPIFPTAPIKNPDCNPNYTVDANGRKHFKPQCF